MYIDIGQNAFSAVVHSSKQHEMNTRDVRFHDNKDSVLQTFTEI